MASEMQWYLKVLKNYVGFQGRARRKEYWMFVLFNIIAAFVLGFIGGLINQSFGLILGYVYGLAVLLPSLAVAVRRLHDTGRSGWMLLLSLIPLVGSIIVLVFLCMDSEVSDNRYGSNQKSIAA
ncbi:Inner membrane protein YhaH [compost metagenome]